MRIWITADTHYGIGRGLGALTEALAATCIEQAEPGDALVIGGDVACGDAKGLADCLGLFRDFPGPKAFVAGNHDLWSDPDRGVGSDALYDEVLPRIARAHGFHLLDHGPLVVGPQGRRIGLAGTYGHFDFTLSDLAALPAAERAEVEEGWRTGRFRVVFWNDYRFHWRPDGAWDHARFAAGCAERLAAHLATLEQDPAVEQIVTVTHTGAHLEQIKDHPAGKGRPLAGRLWFRGVGGSAHLGQAIAAAPKARLAVCGHTHHERDHTDPTGRRWVNIGCDYDRKRWLVYDPATATLAPTPWILPDP